LRACLDVGHARVYSKLPVEVWIDSLSPLLILTHLHNTQGTEDIHQAFNDGVLDMPTLLDKLRALPRPPMFCLELPDAASVQASLPYLCLDRRC
jgi:sugar phosphate isomerase/epimerase